MNLKFEIKLENWLKQVFKLYFHMVLGIILLLSMFISFTTHALSSSKIASKKLDTSSLETTFLNYYDQGLRLSLLPMAKDILVSKIKIKSNENLLRALSEVITQVGTKSFEGLQEQFLIYHQWSVTDYILGRKYFRSGKYNIARKYFHKVSTTNEFYPFALNYLGTIAAFENKITSALAHFKNCVEAANPYLANQQYRINRDYCLMGIARTHFQNDDYAIADFKYLDIDKRGFVWPTVLIEEAWNSLKLGNENRLLGKVTTYKAPQLRAFYRPEADVVKALGFYQLCLDEDVIKTVDSFYKVYEPLLKYIEGTIQIKKDSDQYYFHILENTTKNSGPFYDLINGIKKSPQVFNILNNLKKAEFEKNMIQQNLSSSFQKKAMDFYNDYKDSQENLLGKMTKTFLNKFIVDLNNTFKQMSYLKLEVLFRKKGKLYRGESLIGKRGDVKYLKRSQQQYFWSFKNEFWADELGDYVFALASECKK